MPPCTGTGAISVLFFLFPYGQGSLPLVVLSLIFFALNVLFASTFTVVSILRYALYPSLWNKMLRHPTQNLFLACYPMGVTTLVNVSVVVLHQHLVFGNTSFVYFLWAVWWYDAIVSSICCFVGFHHMSVQL